MGYCVYKPPGSDDRFLGFGFLYGIVIFYTRAKINRNSKTIAVKSTSVVKSLQEGLTGIRDVLTRESGILCWYISRRIFFRPASEIIFISGSPRFAMESIGMTLIAAIAYFMTKQESGIASSLPVLGALALGAQRLLPIMQQAYGAFSSIKGSQASLVDVNELLSQSVPSYADEPAPKPIKFQQSICLENISFRYATDEPWVLESINLTLRKGSRIGIIGATGSGKTTLFDILMGLFTPTAGHVKIDDVVLDQNSIRAWRSRIAHVPQDIYLR